MDTSKIRSLFLNYFEERGHRRVISSSLIPANDPTLLFTNAGMNQFKNVFLGQELVPYKKATSAQRCVRAGGKHNDLENVGFTARHHTFFEMLGNFSFGDYFKREAILLAWQFLTQVLALPPERLWITVYQNDDETADIWLKEIKVDPTRFSRCGEKDNFWSMGDTGPCGPCTEIFYDHGPEIFGGPPGSADEDGDRYVEIWNLVFMQYNRNASGHLDPLPKPSVDTGMGLERVAAVMQGVHNNYDIDIFRSLISSIETLLGNKATSENIASFRVIADHLRSCSFLIADGVLPSNEGRGYVLRRIIRRAIRHGHKIGFNTNFFYQLVPCLADVMGDAYPELKQKQDLIKQILSREEQQFALTLDTGLKILQQTITELTSSVLPGDVVFKLYDTYGFPVDLTADIVREKGLSIDEAGFEQEMEKQRARSQSSSQFDHVYQEALDNLNKSEFHGYNDLTQTSTITNLVKHGEVVTSLKQDEEGIIVLNVTTFYPESGGQVGDRGFIKDGSNIFEVFDTQKQQETILHIGKVIAGAFTHNQTVLAEVNSQRRLNTALNHSATHLLHAALRNILGEHILQKGSLVEPERLRFDFSHFQAISQEQLSEIEALVNQEIRANYRVKTEIMPPQQAINAGALGLFGEKYGDEVRVLSMGNFSKELCGGTHVTRTGDIGLFKIIGESGIAAGIRRIEAVTGQEAYQYSLNFEQQCNEIANLLKISKGNILPKVEQVLEQLKTLQKDNEILISKQNQNLSKKLMSEIERISIYNVLIKKFENIDLKNAREMMDQIRSQQQKVIILFALEIENKISLLAGVSKDISDKIHAGHLVQFVAEQIGGKGGGRPDMAQGGGTDKNSLAKALGTIPKWIQERSHELDS